MGRRLHPDERALADRYKRLRRAAIASLGYDDIAAYHNETRVDERVRTLAYLEAHPQPAPE